MPPSRFERAEFPANSQGVTSSGCWTRTSDPAVNRGPKESATSNIARTCDEIDPRDPNSENPWFPVSPNDSPGSVTESAVEQGHLTVPADLAARWQVRDEVASHPPPDLEVLLATVADRWDIVAQLARELEARRTVASTNAHVAGHQAGRAQDSRSPSQNGTTNEEERKG